MFAIIGIVVVVGAIVDGHLMEHGNLKVLLQPAELVIIGGAALGTMFIANPLPTIIRIFKGCVSVFVPSPFSKPFLFAASEDVERAVPLCAQERP